MENLFGCAPYGTQLEPLGEDQTQDQVDHQADGDDQADDVVQAHSRLTPLAITPIRANTAMERTMNPRSDMCNTPVAMTGRDG
jgi:hypothetical protein